MRTTRIGTTRSALAALALATSSGAVGAEPTAPLASCSAETADRIRFIEERLDARRSYADYWWKGWTGFYGIGTVVQSVQAGLEDDRGRQADYAVSAAKAAFGTVRLFYYPPTARVGADGMRAIEARDEPSCRERLARGEETLRANAKESASRWSWKRHAANVAINVAGGLIVAEGFDESRGWTSAGIGIAVGEVMTFSHPWHGEEDLADYEHRFAGEPRAGTPTTWAIGPWAQGARLQVRF